MSYAVWVDPRLERKMARFPRDVIQSIDEVLRDLRDTPRPSRCRRIHGIPNAWRIVVRKDYRILYLVDDKARHVAVYEITRREKDTNRS
jgi:mRNA-degrading endonuclease RelE of RelBE toxin-antitoxin system